MIDYELVSFAYNTININDCTSTELLSATRDDTQEALITETYGF